MYKRQLLRLPACECIKLAGHLFTLLCIVSHKKAVHYQRFVVQVGMVQLLYQVLEQAKDVYKRQARIPWDRICNSCWYSCRE